MITFLKAEEQHQHSNGGGWVANTAVVAASAYIGPDAWVSDNAQVCDNAWVYGDAQVYGDACVCSHALVYSTAQVYGDAQVFGDAQVCGDTWAVSPLYIQGTRHAITNSAYGFLNVGCIKLSFSEWKKQYKAIGKQQGYTPAQIKEYGTLIKFAMKIGKAAKRGK